MLLGIAHKVKDNEVVIHIAHAGNHINLIIQPVHIFLRRIFAIPANQPLFAHRDEVFGVVPPVGRRELRQLGHAELEFHVAARGNLRRVGNRLLRKWEAFAHLLLAFDIELLGGKLQPALFPNRVVGLDADQNVLVARVLLP